MEYNEKITELKVLKGAGIDLNWKSMSDNPSELFYQWLENAIRHEVIEPQAMTLATSDSQGIISSRVLLVRHVDDNADFYFSTSSVNPTGKQLSENPYASLNFYWKELSQQIIISGKVKKCNQNDSMVDFKKRSDSSKAICLVQKQSEPLNGIETMHNAVEKMSRELESNPGLVNPNWTLFRVIPDKIEFFQGRKTRMHERLVFTRNQSNDWNKTFVWA
ncbi:pyridoxine/pyridoxamine 5'-phosphate oxidase [Gracilibacillus alcaliphilus]|uniref:pyridoxine/pyridoxamine 5'-phosphate oxidase n=1 Tax=Gracilibacillus alcaliphilus TaxID=1401441 RepID=UPI001958886A|nr:pyridoxal 5'-phosphate synthase [Gracilibacillus alcaliphilus]MBM7676725.1 pyridoxamine 5'-phosphate oxidase [Gracilibacillus alcaliphilus]